MEEVKYRCNQYIEGVIDIGELRRFIIRAMTGDNWHADDTEALCNAIVNDSTL